MRTRVSLVRVVVVASEKQSLFCFLFERELCVAMSSVLLWNTAGNSVEMAGLYCTVLDAKKDDTLDE